MNRTLITAIALIGLSACTAQQRHMVDNMVNQTPTPTTVVIDSPAYPPCDAATGYYEMQKDAWTCVQPPTRTDCTNGQFLTKAGYFECRQPTETTIPATSETTIPPK